MRQKFAGSEQSLHPGTEYGRSIARYRPLRRKARSWPSFLDHPMAPVIALGIIAAGALMLWPRQANGRFANGRFAKGRLANGRPGNASWRDQHDGDVEYADFPSRDRAGLSDHRQERSRAYTD